MGKEKLQAIDAIRGYAVFLVIACHSPAYIPDLVWPVKRLLLMGNYGVQLFFLASAVTLLMSWDASGNNFLNKYKDFLTRRIFRIAPFYFLAMPFYWLVEGHTSDEFSVSVLISNLFFYNAWNPYLMPAIPAWAPVPGGWSISVEFCFYIIFPFLALLVKNATHALFFSCFCLSVMVFGYFTGLSLYPELEKYSQIKFLYFWPPNQFIIFAVGFLLFFSLKSNLRKRYSCAAKSRRVRQVLL